MQVTTFANELEKSFRKYFPKSKFSAKADGFGKESFVVQFMLASDATECKNGISHNDVVKTHIWFHASVKDDSIINFKTDMSIGSQILCEAPKDSFKAYDSIKTGWRNFTGKNAENTIERFEKYFAKLHGIIKENAESISVAQGKDVKQYLA